jgi:hypothetical protein
MEIDFMGKGSGLSGVIMDSGLALLTIRSPGMVPA